MTDRITTDDVLENHKELKDKNTWYYKYVMSIENPDEMIEYCLTDSFYLNSVAGFQFFNLGNHNRYTVAFRNKAIDLYKDLTIYLNIKKDTSITKDANDYKHYLGKYVGNNNNSYTIEKQNDNLTFKRNNIADSTITGQGIIYPGTKTNFTIDHRFGTFLYDKNKSVTGFTLSLGKDKSVYRKMAGSK